MLITNKKVFRVCCGRGKEKVPLILAKLGGKSNGREVELHKNLVQSLRAVDRGDKDNQLVEIQRIKEIDQLAVLLSFLQLNIILLETMQGELGAVVDEDLEGLKIETPSQSMNIMSAKATTIIYLTRRINQNVISYVVHKLLADCTKVSFDGC
tara:strand:- start:2814 stop:3272 length:459 start_codon:yes stop_codon:yes gene_type:complete